MPVEETLQALQDTEEFLRQALSRLESVEDSGAIAGAYDLSARQYLLSALEQITRGVKATQRALVASPEHLR